MSIRDNIRRIDEQIAASCAKVGRVPSEITLVAVSKQQSVAAILEAADAGVQHFGENRVEEAMAKIPEVEARAGGTLTWHMVGHIQSRKAKQVVRHFDEAQSVDSLRLATRLSRFAGESNRAIKVLLEINVSGEASKYGLAGYHWCRDNAVKEQLWRVAADIAALPRIQLRGLMTMAPYDADEKTLRRIFSSLRELRAELSPALHEPLPELSMGMTNDYHIAIEEGATMIRLGRALFGERI